MFPQVFCFSLPGLLWEQFGPEGALSAGSLHHSSFLSSPLSFFGPSLCFFFGSVSAVQSIRAQTSYATTTNCSQPPPPTHELLLVNVWLLSVVMDLYFTWPLICSFNHEADVVMCLWYKKMPVGHIFSLVIVYAYY